jgi:valyl-tRNA synthetase
VLRIQGNDFCTLAKGNFLTFHDVSSGDSSVGNVSEVPKGCCVKVLSDQLSLLVDLSGIIDIETEIIRLSKDKERLEPSIDTYRKKISAVGYETKVPENVRTVNTDKLAALEVELEATISAIAAFQLMR